MADVGWVVKATRVPPWGTPQAYGHGYGEELARELGPAAVMCRDDELTVRELISEHPTHASAVAQIDRHQDIV